VAYWGGFSTGDGGLRAAPPIGSLHCGVEKKNLRRIILGKLGLVNAMTKEYYMQTKSLSENFVSGDLFIPHQGSR
jgi:hypothetical protein